jgi:hypothetical protein
MLPIGLDWIAILPAVKVFIAGGNPYLVGEGFHRVYEPPWTYLLLAPFTVEPFWLGRALLFIVSLIAFAYTAIRLGAKLWQLFLFLTSASVMGCLANGNLDWMVLLGLWMPAKYGLFFVLIKPQVGIGIALYWLYVNWRLGGWRHTVSTVTPVTVHYSISFLWYGPWFLEFTRMTVNPENMSAFPWTIPLGLFLLYAGMQNYNRNLAIFSGPLLAPYVSQFSYAACLLALLSRPKLFLFAWILLWIPVLARLL